MGVLYDSIKISQETKSQGMISELLTLGVTETKRGKSIYDLNYYDLRQELAIAKFRNRNVESSENGWF
ncbi:hypothetical protein N5C46_22965 [Rossellomorea vietnamensis]|uniref:Uncharacterized protein n=1 Tax=Rossellomorea vietnamensis TaxID=218284 RepID=A0ACD4CA08_9BACI|nr:hypothetical protein [Rossellomorea vietnamensis]UXH44442.1 hypothetical protein N5C46_22965 [Rossellomorea vietnamensis]